MPDWLNLTPPVRDDMLSAGPTEEEQVLWVMREDPAVKGARVPSRALSLRDRLATGGEGHSMTRQYAIALAGILLVLRIGIGQELGDRLLVGYWHNWGFSPNSLQLSVLPEAYDVINISFAVPTEAFGAEMAFDPDPGIYPDPQDFIDDFAALQAAGKKVLLSIGGANAAIHVETEQDAALFAQSMAGLVMQYGFDGVDIDLEGGSLTLDAGDNDYRNPTTARIVYFIAGIEALLRAFPEGLILSMAPETAYVQGAYSFYGGIWGAYLPVIHALREELSYIHVQRYNTGSMFGRDGVVYEPATADFHVAMADMLLAGFALPNGDVFDPLSHDQVLIGLPASTQAAGTGYTTPAIVHDALDHLLTGVPAPGSSYSLAQPEGYPSFRGLMTWSVNWDVDNALEFSGSHRAYLDELGEPAGVMLRIRIVGQSVRLEWEDPEERLWQVYRSDEPWGMADAAEWIGSSVEGWFVDEGVDLGRPGFYWIELGEEWRRRGFRRSVRKGSGLVGAVLRAPEGYV